MFLFIPNPKNHDALFSKIRREKREQMTVQQRQSNHIEATVTYTTIAPPRRGRIFFKPHDPWSALLVES